MNVPNHALLLAGIDVVTLAHLHVVMFALDVIQCVIPHAKLNVKTILDILV
jgi:hypothetical protein